MPIGSDFAKYTALSTTTKVDLNAGAKLDVPANAKCIVAVQPQIVAITPTADESVLAKVILDSDDLPLKPAEFALAPIQPLLGTTGGLKAPNQPKYPINMACVGGEKITISGQALKTNTVEPKMGCAIWYDTIPPTLPAMHGKVGTLTASGTSVAEVEDSTKMQINGGTVLEMTYGVFGQRTVAASKPYAGRGKVVSSDISPPLPLVWPIAPVQPVLSTAGVAMSPDIVFNDIQLALKSNATLTLSHFLDIALSTQGDFAICVIYT